VLFPEERSNDIQQMGWGNYPFMKIINFLVDIGHIQVRDLNSQDQKSLSLLV